MTTPERILCAAVVIAGVLQLIKMWVPLVNGWAALAANLLVTAALFYAVFRIDPTLTTLTLYLVTALAAAGVHGTMTKLSDHPDPRRNPTPSGLPPPLAPED
jgi:uncharacterized membrane protein HdeD (DUF308 family)